jgi:anionic cell wall polymer biosynthesis LytR-Cps2A-Psr (LCP) family protein
VTLNGPQALAYSRNRHDYGRGDFDRTIHQGQVLVGALTKARTLVDANPGKTMTFLRTIFKNVRLDIPLAEAFRLGLLALQISPSDVKNTLLDGTTGTTSAGSSVLLFNPQPLLANVADDAIIN